MAPRRTLGPRPRPTWGGRRRKGAPRCSCGGWPSRAAAVAAAAAAAVAPSSWQLHREPSVAHASSAVVAKVTVDHSSASSSPGYFSPRDEVSTSSLQPPCKSSPSGCSPQQPWVATCVADADGADAVVGASSDNPSAALSSSLPEEEEPLSPTLQMEFLSPEELEEHLLPTLRMEVALHMVVAKVIVSHLDLAEKKKLATDDLKPLSPHLEAETGEVNANGADVGEEEDNADGVDAVEEEEEDNTDGADALEKQQPLSTALQKEAAIEVLFQFDLASKKRTLSAGELDLISHLKSILPRLEEEIGEVNDHGEDTVEEEEEEEEEVHLSPSQKMQGALKVMFRLDLAREMRILSDDELDLYDDMKSLLPHLEAQIGEGNADSADAVEEEDNADGADTVEEEEEEEIPLPELEEYLLPTLRMEVALQMVVAKVIMSHWDLAEKKKLATDDLKPLSPHLEAETGEVNANGADVVGEEEDNADGVDVVEEDNTDGADALEKMQPLSPALRKEAAIEVLFQLDLASKKRTLSAGELDLTSHLKSILPRLDEEIGEVNDHGEDVVEEEEEEEEEEEVHLSPSQKMQGALKVMFRLDLAREMRILSDDELDLYDDMKSLLPHLEVQIGEGNADSADAVEEEDNANGADTVEEEEEEEEIPLPELEEYLLPTLRMEVALHMVVAKVIMSHWNLAEKIKLATDDLKPLSPHLEAEIGEVNANGADVVGEEEDNADDAVEEDTTDGVDALEKKQPLLPALQKEVAIEVLFQLDLVSKKRTLSAGELDLIIHLKSILPRLEEEIGEVNDHGEDVVEEEEEEEEKEEVHLSPSQKMQGALKVMFRLDLAREMRILSDDELDLYDDMKSLLPHLEAQIGEGNANRVGAVEEEDNADGVDTIEEEEEEEEEPLSPALQKEVAIEILFRFDLARKKRTLSAHELDLIIRLKSLLPLLEAEIAEINEEEEEEEEPLSPALRMEAVLKVMFRLDLAREMRTLSADELDLYDDMKSLLPRLEAEIREVATAPSIALEDPPTCQLHAPSVALAGENEVPSPMVSGASTSIKLYADLQLAERSIVATNAATEPAMEDAEITEALYRHSGRRRRLPIFRDICPE